MEASVVWALAKAAIRWASPGGCNPVASEEFPEGSDTL